MYKKLTITTIILLMLSITVSFAWMMDVMGPSGEIITVNFDNSIYVSPNNLKIHKEDHRRSVAKKQWNHKLTWRNHILVYDKLDIFLKYPQLHY